MYSDLCPHTTEEYKKAASRVIAVATCVTWRGDQHEVKCWLSTSETEKCAIMHEQTCTVDLLGISEWLINNMRVNTCTLPCEHVFHPTALAQHFAYRNMRCPICRAGSDDTMTLTTSELPEGVKTALGGSIKKMKLEDSEDEDEMVELQYDTAVDVDTVRSMLSLHAEVRFEDHSVISLSSRLIPTLNTDEPLLFEAFEVHRSFQRLLFSNIRRFCTGPGWSVSLSLRHPVLQRPICTVPIAPFHFVAESNVFDMTSETTGSEVLAQTRVDHESNGLAVTINIFAMKNLCVHSLVAYIHNVL